MLDSYRPNVGLTFVRQPELLRPRLPYIDRIEISWTRTMPRACPRSWPASTTSAGSFPAPSAGPIGSRSRTPSSSGGPTSGRRVPVERRDPHLDAHRQAALQRRAGAPGHVPGDRPAGHHRRDCEGDGTFNPAVPAALKEWSVPIDQLGEGGRYYKPDPAAAKRSSPPPAIRTASRRRSDFTTYGSTPRRHRAAHPQVPQERRDRDEARTAGVRRLHREHATSASSTR